jgi:hypothetical protein
MELPHPTVIRDFRSDLDQTLDEPFDRPFGLFTHEVEFPEYVQEVVGQDSHGQAAWLDANQWQRVLSAPMALRTRCRFSRSGSVQGST